jgi:hypothetical protein
MTSHKFKFNRSLYQWQQSGTGWKLMRSGDVVAEVVPDVKFPTMFRIKVPGMQPSDMVNLSRAKDGALSLADAVRDGRIRGAQAPCIALTAERRSAKGKVPNASAAPVGANPTNQSRGDARPEAARSRKGSPPGDASGLVERHARLSNSAPYGAGLVMSTGRPPSSRDKRSAPQNCFTNTNSKGTPP